MVEVVNNDNYKMVSDGGNYQALFVNSLEVPYKEIPLDVYKYTKDLDDVHITFWRLYRIVYRKDEGYGITSEHELLDWRQVSVKGHCKDSLKAICDLTKGADQFLY